MKILHIFRDISPQGGAARAMIAIAKYSSRLGDYQHQVVNLLPINYNSTNANLARAIGQHKLPIFDSSDLSEKISASDIVHLHWWKDAIIDQFLQSDLPPMRLLIWFHTAGDSAPHIITPELIERADMAVACNPYTYEEVLTNLSSAGKLAMVYGAADLEFLDGRQPRQHAGFNVGYVGSLTKLHPDFVKMSVGLNIPGVRFTLCGGGANAPKLAQQVAQAQAGARFSFAGYVNDVGTYLETFDVFGYPASQGTAGYVGSELVLQEAMYAQVPPVVFPIGGMGHLVMNGYTGLVVHSPKEYRQAVEHLYRNPEERSRLGRNAASYARQTFGAANAAPKMNALYDRLMEQTKQQRSYSCPVLLPQKEDDRRRISIVVSGRNDNYAGNFEERFLAAYRRNCRELEQAGIDAEWIFVEWNPPNEDYLSYTLADKGFSKCYVVDPDIHEVVCSSIHMQFLQFFAKNVGIRRAGNPWVLVTNPDVVFGPKVVAEMARALDPFTIYRAERRDVATQYFTGPFPEMFHNTLRTHDSWYGLRITEAAGDFMLFNKESLPLLCHDEHIGFSDTGADGRILLNAIPMGCTGFRFLGSVFKADHPHLFCKQRENEYTNKGRTNWNYKAGLPHDSTPDWGMAGCVETELAPNIWYLSDANKRRKMFAHWIDIFGKAMKRKDFHDQTPESLLALTDLVHRHNPTKIVELGTFTGLSLRAWLHASDVFVVTIDWNLEPLKKSLCLLPEDMARVGALRRDASQVPYDNLWNSDDIVLLYIDIHSEVMTQLLDFAVTALPSGSVVVVDDLWYSSQTLTDENLLPFFNEHVRPQVDLSVENIPSQYAGYWKGGSFVGFKEVVPLMTYINERQIDLDFEAGVKIVSWRTKI